MKNFLIAAFAVAVLWEGMWSFWTPGLASPQAVSVDAGALPALQGQPMAGGMMMSGGMMGGMMAEAEMQTEMGAGAPTMAPAAPLNGVSDPLVTNDSSDFIARLDQVQRQLEVVVNRLEMMETAAPAAAATPVAAAPADSPAPGLVRSAVSAVGLLMSQFLVVLTSGPVVGFLVALLLVMLVGIARKKSSVPDTDAPGSDGHVPLVASAAPTWSRLLNGTVSVAQMQVHVTSLKVRTWPATAKQWISTVPAKKLAQIRNDYGEFLSEPSQDGSVMKAAVFNENEVRAAAGLTLALGTVAFVYAYFAKVYAPIQIVTTLFFVEFLIRITFGLKYSPMGIIARQLTSRQTPHWVSAKPKQFAWSIGVFMSLAMMMITNSGIRGTLPLTICLICLTLMWLEAVLGLCLGCEIHGFMVRRGWTKKDEAFEVCAHGACTIEARA